MNLALEKSQFVKIHSSNVTDSKSVLEKLQSLNLQSTISLSEKSTALKLQSSIVSFFHLRNGIRKINFCKIRIKKIGTTNIDYT